MVAAFQTLTLVWCGLTLNGNYGFTVNLTFSDVQSYGEVIFNVTTSSLPYSTVSVTTNGTNVVVYNPSTKNHDIGIDFNNSIKNLFYNSTTFNLQFTLITSCSYRREYKAHAYESRASGVPTDSVNVELPISSLSCLEADVLKTKGSCDYTLPSGQNVTLHCKVSHGISNLINLSWQCSSKVTLLYMEPKNETQSSSNITGSSYKLYSISRSLTVTVQTLTQEECGSVICSCTASYGSLTSPFQTNYTLHFPSLPFITNITSNLTAMEGSSVNLSCSAIGSPTPTVQIFKSTQNSGSSMFNSTALLTLQSVQISDTGWYTCLAESTAGNVNKTFYLAVTGVPDTTTSPATTTTETLATSTDEDGLTTSPAGTEQDSTTSHTEVTSLSSLLSSTHLSTSMFSSTTNQTTDKQDLSKSKEKDCGTIKCWLLVVIIVCALVICGAVAACCCCCWCKQWLKDCCCSCWWKICCCCFWLEPHPARDEDTSILCALCMCTKYSSDRTPPPTNKLFSCCQRFQPNHVDNYLIGMSVKYEHQNHKEACQPKNISSLPFLCCKEVSFSEATRLCCACCSTIIEDEVDDVDGTDKRKNGSNRLGSQSSIYNAKTRHKLFCGICLNPASIHPIENNKMRPETSGSIVTKTNVEANVPEENEMNVRKDHSDSDSGVKSNLPGRLPSIDSSVNKTKKKKKKRKTVANQVQKSDQ